MIKLVCDKCNKESTGLKVWDKVIPPLIVCPKCYKRLVAEVKFNKQPRGNVPKDNRFVKPKVKINGDRMVKKTPITRTNSKTIKVEFYENGIKLYYCMCKSRRSANKKMENFLENGEMPTKVNKKIYSTGSKLSDKAKKNKLKYIREYNKTHTRSFYVMLNIDKDKELIELFDSCKSKAQLLREMFEIYKKEKGL